MIHVSAKDTTIFQLDSVRHWALGFLNDSREPWRSLTKVLGIDLCPRLELPWLRVSIVCSLLVLLVCSDSLADVRLEKIKACPEPSSEHQLCWGLLCSGVGHGTIVE